MVGLDQVNFKVSASRCSKNAPPGPVCSKDFFVKHFQNYLDLQYKAPFLTNDF